MNDVLVLSNIHLWVLGESLGKAVSLPALWQRICFVALLCYLCCLELRLVHSFTDPGTIGKDWGSKDPEREVDVVVYGKDTEKAFHYIIWLPSIKLSLHTIDGKITKEIE